MALDLNFDEFGTLLQLLEERAKAELNPILSRVQSAAIGELGSAFSEGLAIINKYVDLHAKVQAAANAPAPAPEAPAPESTVEEQPTEVLPAVSPSPDEAQPAEEVPAPEAPAEEAPAQ